MLKKISLSAIAVLFLTVTAQASTSLLATNPGKAQFARIAGVDASDFTAAELILLIEARRDNNASEFSFLLSHENRKQPNRADVVTPGEAQQAATLGVNPADFTNAELTAMSVARMDGDVQAEDFIASGDSKAEPSPAEVVTQGEAQLAAAVGVDPADYTLAELVALQPSSGD